MVLKIDTTNREKIKVLLIDRKTKLKDQLELKQLGSQILLPLIIKILKKNKKSLSDIDEIEVETGPGSFTGTRVGVSVANALGFALNIPVNGSPRFSEAGQKGKIVVPKYEKSKFD